MVFILVKANQPIQQKTPVKTVPPPAVKPIAPAPQPKTPTTPAVHNTTVVKSISPAPTKPQEVAKPKPKPKPKYHVHKKKYSYETIKTHEPKKNLVVVESHSFQEQYALIKQKEAPTPAKPDTADFNESKFASIDFTTDAEESDYYDKKTLVEVKKEIANTKKHYILYFGANWCIPCRLMRETVFKAHDVKKYLNQYHITYVDVDNFDGMDIKEMFNVTNIPYMVILNTKGKQIGRIEGSITSTNFSEKLKNYLIQ